MIAFLFNAYALEREVGEGDALLIDERPVSVFAGQHRRAVCSDNKLPELEAFCRHAADQLHADDFIDQPVSAAMLGDVPHAVSVEQLAIECAAIPLLRAGKLSEVLRGERGCGWRACHDDLSFQNGLRERRTRFEGQGRRNDRISSREEGLRKLTRFWTWPHGGSRILTTGNSAYRLQARPLNISAIKNCGFSPETGLGQRQ